VEGRGAENPQALAGGEQRWDVIEPQRRSASLRAGLRRKEEFFSKFFRHDCAVLARRRLRRTRRSSRALTLVMHGGFFCGHEGGPPSLSYKQ